MSDLIPGAGTPDRRFADLRLADWAPRRSIRRPLTPLSRLSVPAVDVHNHLGRWLAEDGTWMASDVAELLELMDRTNVATVVNLDGRWGADLDANVARYDQSHPGRFVTFCHLDWSRLNGDRPADALVTDLRRAKDQGARGVKVWKDLGLSVTDATGARSCSFVGICGETGFDFAMVLDCGPSCPEGSDSTEPPAGTTRKASDQRAVNHIRSSFVNQSQTAGDCARRRPAAGSAAVRLTH